jgi:hypothetical protein
MKKFTRLRSQCPVVGIFFPENGDFKFAYDNIQSFEIVAITSNSPGSGPCHSKKFLYSFSHMPLGVPSHPDFKS